MVLVKRVQQMDEGYFVVAVVLFGIFLIWMAAHLAKSMHRHLPVDTMNDDDLTDRERALVRKFCQEARHKAATQVGTS